MNMIETYILSILRAGDMLRFTIRPSVDERVAFGIEGAESPAGDGLLAQRLGLLLQTFRGSGYSFSETPAEPASSPSKTRRKRRGPEPDRVLWSISPREISFTSQSAKRLGFGTENAHAPEFDIRIPNLPATPVATSLDTIASLVARTPAIEVLEIEFLHRILPEEWVARLDKALRAELQVSGAPAGIPLEDGTLPNRFLYFWLLQKIGWEVRVRVLLRKRSKPPKAVLNLLGKMIFGCDCTLTDAEQPAPVQSNTLDLSHTFPQGWELPQIVPPLDFHDSILADRLHNTCTPRLPEAGMLIGHADGVEVRMPHAARDRHSYIVGAAGTGKSTLLAREIREDMERGEGVILIDPHGDLYRAVMDAVPSHRRKDVFYLDPSEDGTPPGLNILDIPESRFRRRHTAFLIGELLRFFDETWNMRDAGGPVFEMYFRNTMLLLCMQDTSGINKSKETPFQDERFDDPAELMEKTTSEKMKEAQQRILEQEIKKLKFPLSITSFTRVLVDTNFRKVLLENCTDKTVVEFWTQIAGQISGDAKLANMVPYIASKLNCLTQTGFIADLLCAKRNEFRLGERMNRGEIVLLNLNKGILGSYESRLLGTVLMMEVFAAGMQRSTLPENERRPVNVYVDEFQNFVSDNVASMLSEARKFGLRLTLANQTLAQLRTNPGQMDLLEAVLGNVGNIILFRLGVPDAERLSSFLHPFDQRDMQRLPNFHALARLITLEGPVDPVVMKTLAY